MFKVGDKVRIVIPHSYGAGTKVGETGVIVATYLTISYGLDLYLKMDHDLSAGDYTWVVDKNSVEKVDNYEEEYLLTGDSV